MRTKEGRLGFHNKSKVEQFIDPPEYPVKVVRLGMIEKHATEIKEKH